MSNLKTSIKTYECLVIVYNSTCTRLSANKCYFMHGRANYLNAMNAFVML